MVFRFLSYRANVPHMLFTIINSFYIRQYLLPPLRGWRASIQEESPAPSRAIDALIGDKEQSIKKKKRNKQGVGSLPSNSELDLEVVRVVLCLKT